MIRVQRNPAPKLFKSARFRKFRSSIESFFMGGGTRETQQTYPWQTELENFLPQIYEDLAVQFRHKCAYSEIGIDNPQNKSGDRPATLVLHRPGRDAIGADGTTSPDHYWWMIGAWSNWYLASPQVASVKGNQFPVLGPRANVPESTSPESRISPTENSLLLDPCSEAAEDDPAWHLAFYRTGPVGARDLFDFRTYPSKKMPSQSELKSVNSIRVFDLNSPRLLPYRKIAIDECRKHLRTVRSLPLPDHESDFIATLDEILSPDLAFTAARRQAMVLDWAAMARRAENPHVVQVIGDFLLDRCPREIAASVLCDRSYWVEQNGFLNEDKQSRLAGLVESVFPDRGLGERLLRHLSRGRGTTISQGAAPINLAAEPEIIRPVVGRSASITAVKIRNFKAIQEVELDQAGLKEDELTITLEPSYGSLNQERISQAHRWWAFLGENGSGKSCMLQAISLALAGARIEQVMTTAGVTWADFLRHPRAASGEKIGQGRIMIAFSGDVRIDLRFNGSKHWWVRSGSRRNESDEGEALVDNRIYSGEPDMQTYVRAYGATRQLQSRSANDAPVGQPNPVQIENLFDPRSEVTDAKRWLLSDLNDGNFNIAAPVIANLLQDEGLAIDNETPSSTGVPPLLARNRAQREVTVSGVPIELASDGYRSVIAMACDIMRGLGAGLSDMASANGIVLIDEIGAHLHPRWQMAITTKLRRAFPKVQFIVSTHEPLCLRGLRAKEVVRVENDAKFGVFLETIERDPSQHRVDQLLTSEFFGLDSTIDPDIERRFQHYYRILAIPEGRRTPEQKKTLNTLYAYIYEHAPPSLGNTRRDQLIADEVDAYLAERRSTRSLNRDEFVKERRRRRRAIVSRIREIWDRRMAIRSGGGPAAHDFHKA